MRSKCRGNESCYKAGCRSDQCKRAAADARRERRRREREAIGEFAASDIRTRLVSIPTGDASTSGNVAPAPATHAEDSCVAAVLEEISALERPRSGLVAVAVAMAAVLDNPRATSSKPPAAGRLVQVLEKLRSSSPSSRGKLALVRQMTDREG
jgi:hypothetical protein